MQFFANGWVSDIHVFKAKEDNRLSAPPLKVWVATYSREEVACALCTCMPGIGEAYTHFAALLFTAETNTRVKS